MTRNEMIKFIQNNPYIHITHFLFDENEYIYSADNGIVYDEKGRFFEDWESVDGIRMRVGNEWENGWSIKS